MQNVVTIMALDVGIVRTGVAVANSVARIARPLEVIDDTERLDEYVANLVRRHEVAALVVGLPRNLSGEDTGQTQFVREQASVLRQKLAIPVYFTDEALTSIRAEKELKARKKPYAKADIDMLAAVYILEDFLANHREVYEAHERTI